MGAQMCCPDGTMARAARCEGALVLLYPPGKPRGKSSDIAWRNVPTTSMSTTGHGFIP